MRLSWSTFWIWFCLREGVLFLNLHFLAFLKHHSSFRIDHNSFLCKFIYLGKRMQPNNLESCQNIQIYLAVEVPWGKKKKHILYSQLLIIPSCLQNFIEIFWLSAREKHSFISLLSNSPLQRSCEPKLRTNCIWSFLERSMWFVSCPWGGGEKGVGVRTLSLLCFKGCQRFSHPSISTRTHLKINFGILKILYVAAPFIIMDNWQLTV